MTGNNRLRRPAGYTAVEMLVTVAIFSIVVTVVTSILMNGFVWQRRIHAQQVVLGSVRDALETLAREIRLDRIDYERHLITNHDDLTKAVSHVYVKNAANASIMLSNESGVLTATVTQGGATVAEPLSSSNVTITSLQFIIIPGLDPFFIKSCTPPNHSECATAPTVQECTSAGMCGLLNFQPIVTIMLSAQNNSTDPQRTYHVDLQTAVSSRIYLR